ncbi:mycofactocin-coupled SDR family oxidoreductase [Streptomyces sp. NPDC057445]|uniref:mycofactocin-coupled SDR family oxidoreductase n=1 Tax=Streptomyces sp. NPDC057445 TaxID=3346136 RepID=UPI00369C2090
MGRVENKVVAITGAARGQGRSHAVHLAREGADIIAVDLCKEIESAGYAMASNEDLEETARLVRETGRRAVVKYADVRDYSAVRAAVAEGVAEFDGGLDVLIPNAGILPMGPDVPVGGFAASIDVNLIGMLNTVHAALPHLRDSASIILSGSIASFLPPMGEDVMAGSGYVGYRFSKQVLVEYAKELVLQLAPQGIRVNSVHPTSVDTDMTNNEAMFKTYRPDLDTPTKEDIDPILATIQAMPITHVSTADVSHAVVYLASDESRYVTGTQIRIDGGAIAKHRL